MSDLPPGWEWTTLGEIAETSLGKMLDRGKNHGYERYPYLRNVNVQWGSIKLDDLLTMEIPADQVGHYQLLPGDLLVCEGGEFGRSAVWQGIDGYMAFQKAIHRVRTKEDVRPELLRWIFELYSLDGTLSTMATGSTIKHLPQIKLRQIPVPLPPIDEQDKILEAIARMTESIDTGLSYTKTARARIAVAADAYRTAVLKPSNAGVAGSSGTLSDLVEKIEAGRSVGSSSRRAHDEEWGIVKVSSMTWGRFIPTENKFVAPDLADPRFEIREGDILVSRANTESYVGAPVMVGAVRPRLLLSDKSLRLKPKPGIEPRWLLHSLSSPAVRKYISETATGTKDSMRNISQASLMRAPVTIVDRDQQIRMTEEIDSHLSTLNRLAAALETIESRATTIRRLILESAFSGDLTRLNRNRHAPQARGTRAFGKRR